MTYNLTLPHSLSERREVLEKELRKTVAAIVEEGLQKEVKESLTEAGFTEGTATLSWDFYGQYDDEGGTDMVPDHAYLTVNGESVDTDEITFIHHYTNYKGEPDSYETNLYDDLNEVLSSYGGDLYDTDTDEVTVKLGE